MIFFDFQSGDNSKVVWFPSVFAKSYRAPVESTLCSRWVICGHISSNVEFSLHLGNTIKQSGRDMLVCKLMRKWIRLCHPTWWLRPAQRCRRRPHTRPAPPPSCRRGQVKTHSEGGRGGGCLYGEFPKTFLDRVKHHLLHEERVSSLEVSFLFPSMFFWLNLPWDLIDQMEQHDLNGSRECKHYLVFLLDWRDWRLDCGHTLSPLGNPRILRHPEILLQTFYSRTNHLLQ